MHHVDITVMVLVHIMPTVTGPPRQPEKLKPDSPGPQHPDHGPMRRKPNSKSALAEGSLVTLVHKGDTGTHRVPLGLFCVDYCAECMMAILA